MPSKIHDFQIAPSLLGFPEIVAIDDDTFVVSDWNGTMRKIELNTGKASASPAATNPDTAVGGQFRSLCVTASGAKMSAVATKAPWAVVWDLELNTTERLVVDNGPVNAVAFSPVGGSLLIGTGTYPLDVRKRSEAQVQIWNRDENWTPVLTAALPGVCVDWLGWIESANCICAVTGRRTQNGGFVCFLDATTLRTLRIVDCAPNIVKACWTQDWPPAVAAVFDDFSVVHLDDREDSDARFAAAVPLNGACMDGDEIFTTSGQVLDAETGNMIEQFTPLDSCCYVAARPGGGYVGIATTGVLRVWEA